MSWWGRCVAPCVCIYPYPAGCFQAIIALGHAPPDGCYEYGTLFAESGYVNARDADAVTRRQAETIKQLNTEMASARRSGPLIVQAVSPKISERDVEGVRQLNFSYHVLLQRPSVGVQEHVERMLTEVVASVRARIDAQRLSRRA